MIESVVMDSGSGFATSVPELVRIGVDGQFLGLRPNVIELSLVLQTHLQRPTQCTSLYYALEIIRHQPSIICFVPRLFL